VSLIGAPTGVYLLEIISLSKVYHFKLIHQIH
jgi:hypothetical protein